MFRRQFIKLLGLSCLVPKIAHDIFKEKEFNYKDFGKNYFLEKYHMVESGGYIAIDSIAIHKTNKEIPNLLLLDGWQKEDWNFKDYVVKKYKDEYIKNELYRML